MAHVWQILLPMTTMASIAELQNAGVTFEPAEAVAIAQQLISFLREGDMGSAEPPYGPPTAHNVFVSEDGSVICSGCDTAPAVFDVAIFLEALLPTSPRVPGGLRYAIARGTLAVDVSPYDSLKEFSGTLARFETGRREDVVRRLLARSSSLHVPAPPAKDRRRPRVSATELRRALREADARLYQRRIPENTSVVVPPPPRDRTMLATVACVATGALLIVSGEFMHSRRVSPAVVPVQRSAAITTPDVPAPAVALPQPAEPVRLRAPMPSPVAYTPTRRSSVKPIAKRAKAAAVPASARSPVRRGVLDRMRLGWLRKAFRSDL